MSQAMRPNRTLLRLGGLMGIALATVLAGLSSWSDVLIGDRSLPETFDFVRLQSPLSIVTGPIRDVWANGSKHLGFQIVGAADSLRAKLIEDVRNKLSNRCLKVDSLEALSAYGFDPSRGAAFSVVDAVQGYAFALPVAHDGKSQAESFVRQLLAQPISVGLSTNETKPASFSLRFADAANAAFCTSEDPTPRALAPGTTVTVPANKALILTRRDISMPVMVLASCKARFDDGTSGSCDCVIGQTSCAEGVTLAPIAAQEEKKYSTGAVMSAVPTGDAFVAITANDYLLAGNRIEFFDSVLSKGGTRRQLRSDDAFLSLVASLTPISRSDRGRYSPP